MTATYDPNSLQLGRVVLFPVTPDCYQFLYYLATNGNGWRWRYRGMLPPYEGFVQQIHADVLTHFVVVKRDSGERIGYVVVYAADFRNLHAYYGAVFGPEAIGVGYGAEATLACVSYVFASWPFRKLYMELPEFNAGGMTERASGFLNLEATLKDYHYFDGRRWDQYIYSFDREAWGQRFNDEMSGLSATT